MIIKEQIIKTLLISPKTTNEIRIALEKKEKRYNAVDKDLKTLKSDEFIHCKKIKIPGRPGPIATTYDIVYEIPRLKSLLLKYPSLISDMQKNDQIISLLVDKHKSDMNYRSLGDLLQLSATFFLKYLTNDLFFEQYKKAWFHLFVEPSKPIPLVNYEKIIQSSISWILFEMFAHCVIEDNIKDNIDDFYNPDAFKFIQKNRDEYSIFDINAFHQGVKWARNHKEHEPEFEDQDI